MQSKSDWRYGALLLILFSYLLLTIGCKKSDLSSQTENLQQPAAKKEFLGVPSSAAPLTKALAEHLQSQDGRDHVLEKLSKKEGNPVWDKVEIRSVDGDTVMYIPLVLENTNYVNSYIIYRKKANKSALKLIRGRKYVLHGFERGFSGNVIAADLIRLNNAVFGVTKFQISDGRLFGLNKLKAFKAPYFIKYEGAQSDPTNGDIAMTMSLNPEDEPPLVLPCKPIIIVDYCQGVTFSDFVGTCRNVTIQYTNNTSSCTLPPIGPGPTPTELSDPQDIYSLGRWFPDLNITVECEGISEVECAQTDKMPIIYWLSNSVGSPYDPNNPFADIYFPMDALPNISTEGNEVSLQLLGNSVSQNPILIGKAEEIHPTLKTWPMEHPLNLVTAPESIQCC